MKATDIILKPRIRSQSSRDEEALMQMSIFTLSQPKLLVACPRAELEIRGPYSTMSQWQHDAP